MQRNPLYNLDSETSTSQTLKHLCVVQEHVLQRYPQVTLPAETEAIVVGAAKPAVRICNVEKAEAPATVLEVLHRALWILRRVSATNDR